MPSTPQFIRHATLGGLAFLAACLIHEGIGHGGTCRLLGGQIAALNSAVFRCAPGSAWVDVAGPLANLIAALIGGILLFRLDPRARLREALALFVAFNACWGAGYLIYSGVTGQGDWAYALRAIAGDPWSLVVLRVLCGLAGALLYPRSLRLLRPRLPRGGSLMAAYLGAGVASMASIALSSDRSAAAFLEAFNESWLALIGIAIVALRHRAGTATGQLHNAAPSRPGAQSRP
jgi:MFS family permease